jgi:hypothetical protein
MQQQTHSILCLAAVLLASCVDDERPVNPPVQPLPREKNVELTMQIPGTYLPLTYALSESDENEIRTVDVLAFRVDSTGREAYYRHIPVPAILQDNGPTKKIHFRLELLDARLLVLANVRSLFTQEMEEHLRADSATGNAAKEQILKRFIFDAPKPDGQTPEPFPMYGESTIVRSDQQTAGEIKMIRAVARIDVVNRMQDSRLTIDSVYLFHTKSKGFVAPAFDVAGAIAETPAVPADAKPADAPYAFRFLPNAGAANPAMEREIYIAEDARDGDKPTLIILRIARDGRKAQFYRVDIDGQDGEPLPILRNCRYRLNILKILNDGYATAEEAATLPTPSLSSTLEAGELGISTVVFNGQYKLGVSTADVAFRADGTWEGQTPADTCYSLKVHTTCSAWTATWDPHGTGQWLNFADAVPPDASLTLPATRRELRFKATPNTAGQTRTGSIKLTAGTLHLEINVTQHSQATQ